MPASTYRSPSQRNTPPPESPGPARPSSLPTASPVVRSKSYRNTCPCPGREPVWTESIRLANCRRWPSRTKSHAPSELASMAPKPAAMKSWPVSAGPPVARPPRALPPLPLQVRSLLQCFQATLATSTAPKAPAEAAGPPVARPPRALPPAPLQGGSLLQRNQTGRSSYRHSGPYGLTDVWVRWSIDIVRRGLAEDEDDLTTEYTEHTEEEKAIHPVFT